MHITFFKIMGYKPTGVPGLLNGGGILWITSQILVYYSMGKTFNATVDWLGMVDNGGVLPDQDINPYLKYGGSLSQAQGGIEFDPNLLSIEDYRKKVSEHYNTNINTNEWNLGNWYDPDYEQWGRQPSTLANVNYKTPYHPSGITDDGLNCIQGIGCFLADAGVTSMEDPNNPGFGQYTGNQTFSSVAAPSEGYIYNFNPHTERSDGSKNKIYEGDIIQVIQQHDRGRVIKGQPFHAQIVMDAGDSSLPDDERYIVLGDNSGDEQWRGSKYLLSEILENLRKDYWRLSAYDPDLVNKNYKEEEKYNSTFQDNEWINKHASRNVPNFTGPNDKEDWPDNPEWSKTNWMGTGGYDYPDGEEWMDDPGFVYDNYSKYYDKIGALSNMSPEILDMLIHNQGGIRKTESGKKGAGRRQFAKDSAINIFGKERARSWFGGDDPSWRQYYWDKNIKNINSEFDTYDDWVNDIYSKQNTVSYLIADSYLKSPQSKGAFQQKELSPRGRYFFSILDRDINWENLDDQVLASTMLAIDNFHVLKKVHEDLGTKINGKKLTDQHLVDLASLMHSSPGKAQSKEFVEYFFKNHLDGTQGDDGINYLDMIKMYRGPRYEYINENKKNKKLISRKTGGELPKAQDGTETERDRFVNFIKDNEGGYDYIRAKDSAIKKMGEDGEWDGESYYKIFDEGTQKYYPYFLSDEKGATIGHGHHNNNVYEDYKEGISIAKAEELLNLDIDNKMSDTEIWWTSKYGDGEWGNLDESTQYLLGDYAYNTGHIRNYKLFADAIKRGDYETAIKEYKRKDNPGGSYLGRNETYLAEYLQPWIDAQKLNLPAPPLNEMPLPIGVFPIDGEGIEQPMTPSKTYMEGFSPFDYQVPAAVQDNTRVGTNVFGGWKTGGELPNFKEGGSLPKYQSKGQYPAFIKTEREKKGYDQAMSRGWVYDTRLPLRTSQTGPSYFFTQDALDIELEKAGINQTTHYDGRKLNDAGLLTLDQTQGDRMSFSYNKKNEYGRDLSHYVDSDENDRMMKLINTGNWGYNPSTGQMVELNKPTTKQLTATQHVMDTEEFGELTTGFGSSGNYNDEQQIIFDNLSKADQKIVKGLSKDQRKKWVANSMQEVYKNPITYAPGALFFGAFAGPSLLTAGSTDLIGGIAGTSVFDAAAYYGGYHAITHGPEDIQKAIDDPSASNIFDVAMDVLGVAGGAYSTYRGLSNLTKSGKQYTAAYNELKNLNKTNIFKNTLAEGNLSNKQIKLLAENPNLKNNVIKTAIKNDPKITRYTNVDVKQALNSDVTRKALLADGVNIKNEKEVAEWLSTRIHVGGPDIGYRAGAGGSENYLFGDYKYTIPRSEILTTTPSKTKSGQGFTYNLNYGPWQTKMRVKGTEGLLDFTKGNSSDWIKRLNDFETPGINFIKAPDYYGTKAALDPNKLNFNMNPYVTGYPRSSHSVFPTKGSIVDPNQFMFTETPFHNPSAGYFGGRGDQIFTPITTKHLPLKPYQTGEEIDLTPHINTLVERINSPAFKDQVYAQHKNIHGYEPDWDWDAVVAKQIELITKGYEGGTYDPTVMTPLDQDYIDKRANETRHAIYNPSGDIVMGGMQSSGDIEDIGNIYYNQEEFMENPEEGNLVALHELTHRINGLEKTELTPYITQIFGEGDQSGKMKAEQTNVAAEEERNYLKNMMKYGISYNPAVDDDWNDIHYPRSEYNYNWVGDHVGGYSDRENYLTMPGEGHAFKTVLQEELNSIGIHDFNSGAFDDAALERLYNMTAEQFKSLSDSTQEYLRGLGIEEIIYPDGRNGKWLDESSVEDKKNDAGRKENIFQYMNEFWGDKKEGNPFEVTDDFGQELTISKYGGQHDWALDLRPTTIASHGREVKNDDLYSNDRYSKSASKYKKMLPKYQTLGPVVIDEADKQDNKLDGIIPSYEDYFNANNNNSILGASSVKIPYKNKEVGVTDNTIDLTGARPLTSKEIETDILIPQQNEYLNSKESSYMTFNEYIISQDALKKREIKENEPNFEVTNEEMNEYFDLVYSDLDDINYMNPTKGIEKYNELHGTNFTDYESVKTEMDGLKYMQRMYNIQSKYPTVTDISDLDISSRNAILDWSDGEAQLFMALHMEDPNYNFGAWQFKTHSTSKTYADKIRKEVAFQDFDKLRQLVKTITPYVIPSTIEEAALLVGTFGVLKGVSPWIMKHVFRYGDDVAKTTFLKNTDKIVFPKNMKQAIQKYKGVSNGMVYNPISGKWDIKGALSNKPITIGHGTTMTTSEKVAARVSNPIADYALKNAKNVQITAMNEVLEKQKFLKWAKDLLSKTNPVGADDIKLAIDANEEFIKRYLNHAEIEMTAIAEYATALEKLTKINNTIGAYKNPKLIQEYIRSLPGNYTGSTTVTSVDDVSKILNDSRSLYEKVFKTPNPAITVEELIKQAEIGTRTNLGQQDYLIPFGKN